MARTLCSHTIDNEDNAKAPSDAKDATKALPSDKDIRGTLAVYAASTAFLEKPVSVTHNWPRMEPLPRLWILICLTYDPHELQSGGEVIQQSSITACWGRSPLSSPPPQQKNPSTRSSAREQEEQQLVYCLCRHGDPVLLLAPGDRVSP
ncbi:hypothetical protein MHYP_G00264140 [Metynnis hypsauchen]